MKPLLAGFHPGVLLTLVLVLVHVMASLLCICAVGTVVLHRALELSVGV